MLSQQARAHLRQLAEALASNPARLGEPDFLEAIERLLISAGQAAEEGGEDQ